MKMYLQVELLRQFVLSANLLHSKDVGLEYQIKLLKVFQVIIETEEKKLRKYDVDVECRTYFG